MKYAKYITIITAITPFIAHAQLRNTQQLLVRIFSLIDTLTVIVAAIALLVFFWGLVKFILKSGSEVDHKHGRDLMIWGTIALFVMVSVWGIVRFIQEQLNLPNINIINITPGRQLDGSEDLPFHG